MKQYSQGSNPKLTIVIVNYNTKDLLLACLASIKKTTSNFKNPTTEIILVDNASTDGSVGTVRKRYKDIRILRNKENLGFAKAVNQGTKVARGDFIFLLNPDTVVRRGAVKKLLEFGQKTPDTGVVGPRFLNPDGSVQGSVYRQPTIFGAIQKYFLGSETAFGKYAPKAKNPIKVDAVVGGAMLIPRSTIKKIGFLDERFFMYLEDLDYCRRIKRAGLAVYYLPDAKIVHEHGAAGRDIPQKTRNWLEVSSKLYHGAVKYLLLTAILWLGQKWRKFLRL